MNYKKNREHNFFGLKNSKRMWANIQNKIEDRIKTERMAAAGRLGANTMSVHVCERTNLHELLEIRQNVNVTKTC